MRLPDWFSASPRVKHLLTGGLLALAYGSSGYLGLSLAIPPGYATAIFPAAGIALAVLLTQGRALVWGVVLGSLLMNWLASPEHPFIALAIALGAGMQAWTGSYLIERGLGKDLRLDQEQQILHFQLLGGPLSCLISASLGTLCLRIAGLLQPEDWAISWLTWWIGDTLGVLVLAPLSLLWLGQPKALWRKRQLSVGLPLLISSALVVLAFLQVNDWEAQRLHQQFSTQASYWRNEIDRKLQQQRDVLLRLQLALSREPQLTAEIFQRLTDGFLQQLPAIHAIEWQEWLPDSERAEFERREGIQLTERHHGKLVPAGIRPYYLPIRFIEPMKSESLLRGFDQASVPERRQSMERAQDHTDIELTPPITLIKSAETGYLLILAVHQGSNLRGYLAIILNPRILLEQLFQGPERLERHLEFRDHATQQLLYRSNTEPVFGQAIQSRIQLANREFELSFWASSQYWLNHRSWQPWSLLAFGMLLSALLGSLLLLASGRSARIQQLVEDQTEKLRRHQHEMHLHNLQLQQSKNRLRTIFHNLPDVLLILSPDGLIQEANLACFRLLGYREQELHNAPFSQLLPGIQLDQLAQLKQGLPLEVKAQTQVGTEIALELSASQLLPLPGEWILLLHDLTERHKVERLKDEFVSVVSHELRTPLTSIQGSLSLLSSGVLGVFPDNARQMLQIAANNAGRLNRLINDLLDINRLEQGGLQLELTACPVMPLLTEAVAANQGYASRFNVRLQPDWPIPADLQLNLAPDRFIQILNNLISNAIKFSPTGGSVEIQAEIQQDRLRISVRDQGSGIPIEFQPQLFHKFTQANSSPSRDKEGSGLGLAIAQHLTQSMHGQIGFSSEIGVGTCFWLSFPLSVA